MVLKSQDRKVSEGFFVPSVVREIERELLAYIRSQRHPAHTKLVSVRKLAVRFETNPGVIYRAISRLVDQGYLYARRGSGTYVSERPDPRFPLDTPFTASLEEAWFARGRPRTLRARIMVGSARDQQFAWQQVLAQFHQEYPFLRIEPRFDQVNTADLQEVDLLILPSHAIHSIYPSLLGFKIRPPLAKALRDGRLDPVLLELGQIRGTPYGLPLLRLPPMIFVNRALLKRCGVSAESIRKPVDLLRVGYLVETKLGGSTIGVWCWGFTRQLALHGIDFRRQGARVQFDLRKMRSFLEQSRPFIGPRDLDPLQRVPTNDFLAGRCAVFSGFSYLFSSLPEKPGELAPIRIPLEEGGYVPEGIWMGCVTGSSPYPDDSLAFLEYLIGKSAQQLFAQHYPQWLSVRSDVRAWQRAHSPFPPGAVVYDFDPRAVLPMADPSFFEGYCNHLHTEMARYFKGMQDVDRTIAALQRGPAPRMSRR